MQISIVRKGFRTAAASKMELFVIIVNGWKPLTIITKSSRLDVAAVLNMPLIVKSSEKVAQMRPERYSLF